MLSRSFSVPKDTVELDVIGDVSMQSGEDEGDGEDAEMPDQGSAEEVTTEAQAGVNDHEGEGNDDGEGEAEEDESDDDESEAEPEEEEVMVPVADILNAAFGLDNVS
jgi:hypothetical protein